MFDAFIQMSSETDGSLNATAALSALQQAAGGQNRSESNSCTNINQNMSTCEYINQVSCCTNNSQQLNQNIVGGSCGPIKGISQDINTSSYNTCMAAVKGQTSALAKFKAGFDTFIETAQETISQWGWLFLVLGLIAVCCILFWLYKKGYFSDAVDSGKERVAEGQIKEFIKEAEKQG